MTINKQFTVVIDSANTLSAPRVETIYQVDILIEKAEARGEHTIVIKEPAADILNQLNNYRPKYKTIFNVA